MLRPVVLRVARQVARRSSTADISYSLIYRHIRPQLRCTYSTPAHSQSTTEVSIESAQNSNGSAAAPRPKPTRYLRTLITVLAFFVLGGIGGGVVAGIIIPPPLPIPDSEEDAALFAKLKRDIAALDVVRELRSPESKATGWVEYEAFMGLPEEVRDHNMSAGALRGTRSIGIRRMWWNAKSRELVGVIFLGGALCGWPGVIHGGVVATVLIDGIATIGNGGPRETRGLMSTAGEQDIDSEMVREFGIRYLKPTNANRLFIIRAEYQDQQDDIVSCWIEDILSGRTTATATGKVGKQSVIHLGGESRASSEGFFSRIANSISGVGQGSSSVT